MQQYKDEIFLCFITEYRSLNVKLEEVKAELRENRRFLRSVFQILQNQPVVDECQLPEGVRLPLESSEELKQMNECLHNDAAYRKRMVSYVSSQRMNMYCSFAGLGRQIILCTFSTLLLQCILWETHREDP